MIYKAGSELQSISTLLISGCIIYFACTADSERYGWEYPVGFYAVVCETDRCANLRPSPLPPPHPTPSPPPPPHPLTSRFVVTALLPFGLLCCLWLLTIICHRKCVCIVIILSIGSTQISTLFLCFLYLFAEFMTRMYQ